MRLTLDQLAGHIRSGARTFIIGNGGSYANAQHLCNDILLCGYPAFTLDPATLTAFANDFGYDEVYRRWLSVVATPGDLLIALSGSGRSPNIVAACNEAKRMDLFIHLETYYLQDHDMQQSEELQVTLAHNLMRALRAAHR